MKQVLYLLQHAHNPVNWKAWNKETLAEAKSENKLMLNKCWLCSVSLVSCYGT